MRCFVSSTALGRPDLRGPSHTVAVLLLSLLAASCSNHKLATADARRLIESSGRFTDPNVLTVRSRYCSTVDAPSDNPGSGLGRLKALEGTGAIRIEHRAAAPNECASTPGPMREWLVISLTDVGRNFHPGLLDEGVGWEFTLAHRQFLSIGDITFNSDGDPTIAHAPYRWAWKSELIGQLMQVSEDPVNAQATFTRPEGEWVLRDVGF